MFDLERNGVELAWNPPQRCGVQQTKEVKCRMKNDIFFFTFTMGNTKSKRFWVGQNSFGFYIDYQLEMPEQEK